MRMLIEPARRLAIGGADLDGDRPALRKSLTYLSTESVNVNFYLKPARYMHGVQFS